VVSRLTLWVMVTLRDLFCRKQDRMMGRHEGGLIEASMVAAGFDGVCGEHGWVGSDKCAEMAGEGL
jgi:hypothetical protein